MFWTPNLSSAPIFLLSPLLTIITLHLHTEPYLLESIILAFYFILKSTMDNQTDVSKQFSISKEDVSKQYSIEDVSFSFSFLFLFFYCSELSIKTYLICSALSIRTYLICLTMSIRRNFIDSELNIRIYII